MVPGYVVFVDALVVLDVLEVFDRSRSNKRDLSSAYFVRNGKYIHKQRETF